MKSEDRISVMLTFFLIALMFSGNANAVGLDAMFSNFSNSAVQIVKFFLKLNVVLGIYLIISAIFKFAKLGESPNNSPRVPIVSFFIGAFLIAITGSLDMVSQSIGQGAPVGNVLLSANVNATSEVGKAGIKGVLVFIQMVGLIAFIRGWMLLNKSSVNNDSSLFNKGLTHILGGILAWNITTTAQMFSKTFGMPIPFLS